MIDKITGIILAGGKSSRMGKDKPFVLFSGRPLIEIVIDKLSALFENLLIVTNKPWLYKKYGIKTLSDILKERGPLGGIYTGLAFSQTKYNFIVACDMPFIKPDLIRYMMEKIEDNDVIIPKWNDKFEPLYAIYSRKCIKPIEKQLSKDNLKITDFFKDAYPIRSKSSETAATPLVRTSNGVKVRIIAEKETVRFDPERLSFVNINTPEDYRKFKYIMDLKWKNV